MIPAPNSNADRNAAIWFAPDAFAPKEKGINGRRVAGESFLRGFLTHAVVDEFVALAQSRSSHDQFAALAKSLRPDVPVRRVSLMQAAAVAPVACVNYPSPNFAPECWRRAPYGQTAYSLCGITHTTSTAGVMQGFFDLRMAPHADWDAVICTSQAVRASVVHQMELIDDHIKRRFNALPPAWPQLPVIPLGVHVDDFTPDPAAGLALRARLGIASGDVVLATIARLTPNEKFDPLPLYIALQAAQTRMPAGVGLHLVLCGMFREDVSRAVFTRGAKALMPDVGFHLLDGADAAERSATLSGADIFTFMIDNIQETFGLAPIEAMAAGLPQIVSDWDGMKDTVTPDTGFRIKTRSLTASHTVPEAKRYQGGADGYLAYCAAVSAMTQIDVPDLTAKIVTLAKDPDLRARMGAAGLARARALYDWSRIIPQMQDLWADLAARRHRAAPAVVGRYDAARLPVAPSPMGLFAGYPTKAAAFGSEAYVSVDLTGRPSLAETLALRNYMSVKRQFESSQLIDTVLTAINLSGPTGTTAAALTTALATNRLSVERVMVWLLKYDFIRLI